MVGRLGMQEWSFSATADWVVATLLVLTLVMASMNFAEVGPQHNHPSVQVSYSFALPL